MDTKKPYLKIAKTESGLTAWDMVDGYSVVMMLRNAMSKDSELSAVVLSAAISFITDNNIDFNVLRDHFLKVKKNGH